MNNQQLNLARKWRSKQFDEIVGQDISVKILKNSLYLNQFFPVYLFAGQRGCGKTSMARIFAAAVNCQALELFQKNPKQHMVPCLTCESCMAMATGQHPDCIEIDAASHTGVDNVRQIIDASSFLPILGRRKVYLIDEAHMLSKAAFNAFLKVMEEPPVGVLFILATTDSQKIIDTVRSRCFQLIFKPIAKQYLADHLVRVCTQETIRFTREGLELIVDQSEGSVRDALNLLEQVRFASSQITVQTVRSVLGHIDDASLIHILYTVLHADMAQCIALIEKHNLDHYSADYVWKRSLEILRTCLWAKQGAAVEHGFIDLDICKKLIKDTSAEQLFDCMHEMYMHELTFTKTHEQHAFYEMILLQLCKKNSKKNNSGSAPAAQQVQESQIVEECDEDEEDDEYEDSDDSDVPFDDQDTGAQEPWQLFLRDVTQLQEPLLDSIFMQAAVPAGVRNGELVVLLSEELSFFNDWIDERKDKWLPLLARYYPSVTHIKSHFTLPAKQTVVATHKKIDPVVANTQPKQKSVHKASDVRKEMFYKKRPSTANAQANVPQGAAIDVSDVTLYPKTNMILHYFPSTVLQIQERA